MIEVEYTEDTHRLPSGELVDLKRLDVYACRTSEDCHFLLDAISRSIAEIEFQIDAYDAGYHADGEPFSKTRPGSGFWRARAKRALAHQRTNKAAVTNRLSILMRKGV